MKLRSGTVLFLFAFFPFFSSFAQNVLWYSTPADATAKDKVYERTDDLEWMKALPVGNGKLGAMVFGGVGFERIQLDEESMWSGSLQNADNPAAYPALAQIRQYLFEGKYKEASELTAKTQICVGEGSNRANASKLPFGSFQTLGDLWLDFENKASFTNYKRELSLDDAIAKVTYTQKGINFKREIFSSYPDQVLIIRLTASKPGQISFTGSLSRPERFTTSHSGNQLVMNGVLSDGKGGDGLQYMARLSATTKKGIVTYKDNAMTVRNADEVILYVTASTDYLPVYPIFKGRDYASITLKSLENAKQKTYNQLLGDHLAEYQKYFKRVSLNLSTTRPTSVPTDKLLQDFKNGQHSPYLYELIFQYGRYLLISSSRPGSLPANLQGKWANKIQTPWNGDYHPNINVQMNYWPAEVTNLSELHEPLFDWISSIVEPGRKTTKIQYNASGWTVHTINNLWGFTSPGEAAGWGLYPAAGAWISSHLSEHYKFTKDKAFMVQKYGVMKSSCEFYLDWLVTNPRTGQLVSGPANSPENMFFAPDGSKAQISMGPAHDQQVIWNLFNDFIYVSEELGIHDDFVQKIINAKDKLAPTKIASDGRLMEWPEEFKEVEPGHRHISHLFALHPGSQINLKQTPELAAAAKKSLDLRVANFGKNPVAWSSSWLISQYARLEEGEKSLANVNTLLAKSISPNLFSHQPPFQMDANFGATAGIAEMLIQSHAGEIKILPALPKSWNKGEVKGLCARGGFVIDIKWDNGVVTGLKVFSRQGGACKLNVAGKITDMNTEREKTYEVI